MVTQCMHFLYFLQNELSAILRFGAEELFKEEKNDEENKRKLENMDIDEILERAEKVETKESEGQEGAELLNAFKARNALFFLPSFLLNILSLSF